MQRIETAGEVTSEDPVAEVERLEAEVKRLREDSPRRAAIGKFGQR